MTLGEVRDELQGLVDSGVPKDTKVYVLWNEISGVEVEGVEMTEVGWGGRGVYIL